MDSDHQKGLKMALKSEELWEQAAEALSDAVDQIATVEGVISVHAQYAEPVPVLVVLVDSEEARRRVKGLSCLLSHGPEHVHIDFHVQHVPPAEVKLEQDSLATAFSLLWPRS